MRSTSPTTEPGGGRKAGAARPRSAALACLLAALAVAGARTANAGDAVAGVESRAIEALIASVAGLSDATFLRNGKAYPAASAARLLREKWRSRRDEVRTADEFIERVASFSSTTSQPYRIRFADGREVPSAEFLRAELAKVRASGAPGVVPSAAPGAAAPGR